MDTSRWLSVEVGVGSGAIRQVRGYSARRLHQALESSATGSQVESLCRAIN